MFFATPISYGQDAKTNAVIQPKIMVVPFTTGDQSMADELKNNSTNRLAMSLIKEGFDQRGFPTVDLNAKLNMLANDRVMELENQASFKQEVIELSGADIYVQTETTINRSSGGNSVTVILTGYDAFTGVSLANKSSVSPKFYTDSYEKLVQKAVEPIVDDFLNMIQSKFDDIKSNGRMIAMNITCDQDAEKNLDFEFNDSEYLSDKITSWLENNAYNSYFHIQGVTATKMIIDEIRVPLLDDKGKNYRVSKFVNSFRKFLKSLDLDSSRDLQGGRIFITIS